MAEPVDLTLAHSPDSDDLVMWWPLTGAMGSGVETGRYRFETVARDVEELNRLVVGDASQDRPYDVTAISCAAYPYIADRYAITACGGSFGEGYGPKVVVRDDSPVRTIDDLRGTRIGVPGVRTSAFLTLSLMLGAERGDPAFGHAEMLFSDIPGAVARGEVDAGLLIHEAQLTFADLELRAVVDLGQWWQTQTDLPLALGLNVLRRDLDDRHGEGTVREVAELLAASVRHAVAHKGESREFLRRHAGDRREWEDDALVDTYLAMYVSGLTMDMGDRGRRAISELLTRGVGAGLLPECAHIDVV